MTSVIDFLEYNDMTIWRDDNGDWWASDEDWWSSKAKICERDGIDILIDDSERYAPYFKDIKTEFILFKDCNFDNILQGIVNTIRKEGTDIK